MSLILEALRKSEEQRRLGEVPTLATDSAWGVRRRREFDRRGLPWWLWATPLVLVIGIAAAWWHLRAPVESATTSPAPTRAQAPAPNKPTRANDLASAPLASAPIVRDAPTTPPPPAAAPVPSSVPADRAVTPPPATPDDQRVAALDIDPTQREAFQRGEVFANSADQIARKPPTTEQAYVPPEAALPQPIDIPPPAAASPEALRAAEAAGATQANAETLIAPEAHEPAPVAAIADASTTTSAPPPQAPASAPATTPAPLPMGANPAVPGYEPPIPNLYDLPYAQRQGMPKLKVSMHVYAADPAQRFVIIDDTRAGEGQPLGNDLNVVEIRADSVVLEFRGQRFQLPRNGR